MWEANERAEAEKAVQQKQQKAEDQQKAQESLRKEVCILATPGLHWQGLHLLMQLRSYPPALFKGCSLAFRVDMTNRGLVGQDCNGMRSR